MEGQLKEMKQKVSTRVSALRLRTWTLTLSIVVAIVFYYLVNVVMKQSINIVDFIFLTIIQVVAQCIYFPDGELFGAKNEKYISNKNAYNTKANEIAQKQMTGDLREYCKIDYERRKKEYILNECSYIGITLEDLEYFKTKTPYEIKELEKVELKNGDKTKIIVLTRKKKKRLIKLLFKRIPVEPNNPDTIMSAIENDSSKAIHDESIAYKTSSYLRKILTAVLLGGIFAYIGYTVQDGISFADIVNIFMYLTALFTTAVTAFSSGEICTKVYKTNFYIKLSNFIDSFNEWRTKNKKTNE